jgi:WSC domain
MGRTGLDVFSHSPSSTSSSSTLSSTTSISTSSSSISSLTSSSSTTSSLSITTSTSLFSNSSSTSSSTTSSSSSLATPTGWRYDGCYIDNANGRIFNNQQPDNSALTVESCINTCSGLGYTIAGMEYGGRLTSCSGHCVAYTDFSSMLL